MVVLLIVLLVTELATQYRVVGMAQELRLETTRATCKRGEPNLRSTSAARFYSGETGCSRLSSSAGDASAIRVRKWFCRTEIENACSAWTALEVKVA